MWEHQLSTLTGYGFALALVDAGARHVLTSLTCPSQRHNSCDDGSRRDFVQLVDAVTRHVLTSFACSSQRRKVAMVEVNNGGFLIAYA